MAEQSSRGSRRDQEGVKRGDGSGGDAGERQGGDDGDAPVDVFQWVAKTRVGPGGEKEEEKEEEKEKKQRRQTRGARGARGARGTGERQDGDGQPKIKEHAMVAMEDIGGGEEMILTLEDRGVLDEEGGDVLENVREAELKRNAHGRKQAEKAKPLWEEDGVRRGLLDKYDEEEEEATYVLGGGERSGGRVGADAGCGKVRQGTDVSGPGLGSVKARLEEAKMALLGAGGDYYTAEEMAKGKRKKKGEEAGVSKRKTKGERKQRKLKKKALTADEIEEMEVAVGGEVEKAGAGSRHVGSREEREARVAAREAEELAAKETARGRFDSALARANMKSEGLRVDRPGEELGAEEAEEEMLAGSMAKARAVALHSKRGSNVPGSSVEDVARLAIARREKVKEAVKAEDGLTFTDVGEFARSIATRGDLAAEDGGEWDDGDGNERRDVKDAELMDVDVKEEEIEKAEKKGRKRYRRHGGDEDGMAARGRGADVGDPDAMDAGNTDPSGLPTAAGNDKLGPGLGSVLSLLKDRGELNRPIEWGGRASDSRNSFFTNAMGGFSDVYTGGCHDNELAANVEVALTRKDEFGRIMTPKEAFRQLCYSFHGIRPSLNTKEKRLKQVQKELAQKQRNTSALSVPASTKQSKRDTPFVSLDGKSVKPGQRRE